MRGAARRRQGATRDGEVRGKLDELVMSRHSRRGQRPAADVEQWIGVSSLIRQARRFAVRSWAIIASSARAASAGSYMPQVNSAVEPPARHTWSLTGRAPRVMGSGAICQQRALRKSLQNRTRSGVPPVRFPRDAADGIDVDRRR